VSKPENAQSEKCEGVHFFIWGFLNIIVGVYSNNSVLAGMFDLLKQIASIRAHTYISCSSERKHAAMLSNSHFMSHSAMSSNCGSKSQGSDRHRLRQPAHTTTQTTTRTGVIAVQLV
jgi:hypothetical protein